MSFPGFSFFSTQYMHIKMHKILMALSCSSSWVNALLISLRLFSVYVCVSCCVGVLLLSYLCFLCVHAWRVPLMSLGVWTVECFHAWLLAREPLLFISTHTSELTEPPWTIHTIDMIIACEVLPCAVKFIKIVPQGATVVCSRSDSQCNLKYLTCKSWKVLNIYWAISFTRLCSQL